MSNNASLSSAKRRRGGGPPPMSPQTSGAGGGNLPPGLPPNFRQLPPQIQQQMLRQIQQRGPPPPSAIPPSSPANIPAHINKVMSAPNAMGGGVGVASGNGPYVVNSVLHNRATVEVSGLHIRDLPMTSTGLPCLPSGAPLPPNVLFKLHHDELLNQDATLNEHSNRLQLLANRVDKIEKSGGGGGGGGSGGGGGGDGEMSGANGSSYESIVEDGTFIAKVVDNILTNTNLSDIINQIEPLQKENEALRGLLNSQQTTLNELSGLVMKLLNNGLPTYGSNNANDGDYLNYDASASVTEYNADDVTKVDTNSNAVDGKDAVVEEADEAEEADALDDGVES